jgi:hypothetical protein
MSKFSYTPLTLIFNLAMFSYPKFDLTHRELCRSERSLSHNWFAYISSYNETPVSDLKISILVEAALSIITMVLEEEI